MCDPSPSSLGPRILAFLGDANGAHRVEDVRAALVCQGVLCEAHQAAFDMAVRRLLRQRKVLTDSGPDAMRLPPTELGRVSLRRAPVITALGPGAVVDGRLELLEEIGRGGMAVVFRARHVHLKREVALKFFSPDLLHPAIEKGEAVERFYREARAIASLPHPHIVPIYDMGREGENLYYTMELLGESLDDKVRREGPQPWPAVMEIMLHTAEALKAAHDRGIRHRDVKLGNILLPGPRMADFGVAQIRPAPSGAPADYSNLTRARTLIGTLQYMAPECARFEEGDHRSDQYSLGVAMREALTARPIFEIKPGPEQQLEWMYHQAHERPQPILELRPDCPREFAEVVERTLAKRAEDRYQSWAALVGHLKRLLSILPHTATRTPTKETAPTAGAIAPSPAPATTVVSRRLSRIDYDATVLTWKFERRYGAGCFLDPSFAMALYQLAQEQGVLRVCARVLARERGLENLPDFEARYLAQLQALAQGADSPDEPEAVKIDLRDYIWIAAQQATREKETGGEGAREILRFLEGAVDDPRLEVFRFYSAAEPAAPKPAAAPEPWIAVSELALPTDAPPAPAALPQETTTRLLVIRSRREEINRLHTELGHVVGLFYQRFGQMCFGWNSANPNANQFLEMLFNRAASTGVAVALMQRVLERHTGKPMEGFAEKYGELLVFHAKGATPPPAYASFPMELPQYATIALNQAQQEVQDDKEPDLSVAQQIIGFLREAYDDPALALCYLPPKTGASVPVSPDARLAVQPTTELAKLVGQEVGSRRIERQLGRGGMGAIYEAFNKELDRLEALKVLSPSLAADEEFVKRFIREAKSAARVEHPNVVQVYDAGRHGAFLWIAMQLVRGRTLKEVLLERQAPLGVEEALRLVRQAAEGLAAAHEAGLIHRDIKPENLMLDESGRVKILDFGLTKARGSTQEDITGPHILLTPAYASPEQAADRKDLDPRTDLYSLGVVLYELLTGARPYAASSTTALLGVVANPAQPPVPLRERNRSLPIEVEDFVHRLIAKDREARFSNATEVINAIDDLLATLDRSVARRRARKRLALAGVAATALAAVALFLLLFLSGRRSSDPEERLVDERSLAATDSSDRRVAQPTPPSPPEPPPAREPERPEPTKPSPELAPKPPAPLPEKMPDVPAPPPGALPLSPTREEARTDKWMADYRVSPEELQVIRKTLSVLDRRDPEIQRQNYAPALAELAAVRADPRHTSYTRTVLDANAERLRAAAALRDAFRAKLMPGSPIELRLADGRSVAGTVQEPSDTDITLKLPDPSNEVRKVPRKELAEETYTAGVDPTREILYLATHGNPLVCIGLLSKRLDAAKDDYLPELAPHVPGLVHAIALRAIASIKPANNALARAADEKLGGLETVLPQNLRYALEPRATIGYEVRAALALESKRYEEILSDYELSRAYPVALEQVLEAFQAKASMERLGGAQFESWDKSPFESDYKVRGKHVYYADEEKAWVLDQPQGLRRASRSEPRAAAGYVLEYAFSPAPLAPSESSGWLLILTDTKQPAHYQLAGNAGHLVLNLAPPTGADPKTMSTFSFKAGEGFHKLAVIPVGKFRLVYHDGNLAFRIALEKDAGLETRLQLGVSGGKLKLRSLRACPATDE